MDFLLHLSDTNAANEVDDAGGEPSPEHGVSGEPVADLDVGAFGGNGVGVAFLERFWQKTLSLKAMLYPSFIKSTSWKREIKLSLKPKLRFCSTVERNRYFNWPPFRHKNTATNCMLLIDLILC